MDAWLIWLLLAVVLGLAEILTLTAALGMLGGGAAITAGFAALGLPLPAQIVVFTIATVAGVVVVRPIALRHMSQPPLQRFGVDALVGRQARVVREVSGQDGRIRIDGEEWTARAFDDTVVIPVGATVDVLRISGATAFVYPRE